jgi:hypothetical protein
MEGLALVTHRSALAKKGPSIFSRSACDFAQAARKKICFCFFLIFETLHLLGLTHGRKTRLQRCNLLFQMCRPAVFADLILHLALRKEPCSLRFFFRAARQTGTVQAQVTFALNAGCGKCLWNAVIPMRLAAVTHNCAALIVIGHFGMEMEM